MKNSNGNSKPVENKSEALTFRKAVKQDKKGEKEEKVIPKTPQAPTPELEKSEEITPIALHEELKGVPYTAVYFEIDRVWDSPDLSFKEDVEAIENYYRQKVASGEIEDSKKTYEELIKKGEKATNTKNAPANLKIAKIAEFFKFMARLDKIDKERRRWQS